VVNPKPIEFTAHADEMMAARGISRNQVVNAVRRPSTGKPGNTAYTQRLEREFPPSRRLVVIVEELVDRFKVVTVYWK
jgi:hypothetical protein